LLVAGCKHARKQIVERIGALQIPQARRIRRRNIDRKIVRDIREGRDPARVVGHAIG